MVMFTFPFSTINTHLGQIWYQIQNCQFKLKPGTKTNLNMQKSMAMFFCFLSELLFLGKFDPKNQNSLRKLKFGTYINLNMWNSVVPFVLSVLDWKYSLGKFGPKN